MAGSFLQLPMEPRSSPTSADLYKSASTQKLKEAAAMQSYMKAKEKNNYWESGDSRELGRRA